MEATVKIGDTLITITQASRNAADQTHVVTVTDAWNVAEKLHPTKCVKTATLPDEPAAIKFLQDFLNVDLDPNGPFTELFPEFAP